jgi:hypothetical protein
MFALEFSALLDGLSIQVALDDPEVDSQVAYDIAMRFAERELNLPTERRRTRPRSLAGTQPIAGTKSAGGRRQAR